MSQTSAEHLAMTRYFIDENPVTITIFRRARTATGTGGWTWSAGTSLAPFVARMVGTNLRSLTDSRTTVDGQTVVPTRVLIAMPDEDVEVGDQFTLNGLLYEVVSIGDLPKWRINAEVYEHAAA